MKEPRFDISTPMVIDDRQYYIFERNYDNASHRILKKREGFR